MKVNKSLSLFRGKIEKIKKKEAWGLKKAKDDVGKQVTHSEWLLKVNSRGID